MKGVVAVVTAAAVVLLNGKVQKRTEDETTNRYDVYFIRDIFHFHN